MPNKFTTVTVMLFLYGFSCNKISPNICNSYIYY